MYHQNSMRKQKNQTGLVIVRIFLACIFIFSGLSKAIDPVAMGIKMDEYFASFGMGFIHPFALELGILAVTAELVLGFMLLFRIRVNLATLGYLLFMVFFFFLTLWLAVAEHLEVKYGYDFGVVKDCGCFGQVVEMSNLQTFLKNIVLMILTLIVFGKRKSIPDMKLTLFGQWLFACIGVVIALLIQFYCLRNLPVIDFSDWKKGNNVVDLFVDKPAEKKILFLYQNKNGVEKLLSMEEMENILEDYPNFYEEFDYVDRIDSVVSEGVKAKHPGFSMVDNQGGDFANTYLNKAQVYLLFMHHLDEVDMEAMRSENLQHLISYCTENNIDLVAVTNSPPHEIDEFIETNHLNFPIYYNAIDPVKGPFIVRDAIRSNPGLIILEHGVVVDKKPWRQF